MASRIIAIAGIIVLAAVILVAWGWVYFVNFSPDRARYPVRGVDVSHHQGVIDWTAVAAADVRFAILKATEGGDHVDDTFAYNLAGARAAGLEVGAYHFFTFCRAGADQARNFLATVPLDVRQLPPVVDIEFGGNCAARPPVEVIRAELAAFLEPVEAAFGRPAIVYLLGDTAALYGDAVPKRQRWVRSLAWHPGDEDWTYWQYHDRGRVNGIIGDVDLNVLQGGAGALQALVGE